LGILRCRWNYNIIKRPNAVFCNAQTKSAAVKTAEKETAKEKIINSG
jgi:hypothetical protein